jgi:hypothetical protein
MFPVLGLLTLAAAGCAHQRSSVTAEPSAVLPASMAELADEQPVVPPEYASLPLGDLSDLSSGSRCT